MAKKQFLKLRRLAEDQDITTDELAAKAGIVPRTLRKRFAAPESCGTWNWEEIDLRTALPQGAALRHPDRRLR